MRLLIAENDASLATFLSDGFGAEHYTVDLTHTSDEAKTVIQKNEYDAAILDLNLPQADSMEILQHFRSKRPQLPILILTNRNRPEERGTSARSGSRRFGPKTIFVRGTFGASARRSASRSLCAAGHAAHGRSRSKSGGTFGATCQPHDRVDA
jgi:DNA-binding response OmpR family regulator